MQRPRADTAAPCGGIHGAQAASPVLPRLPYLPEAGGSPAAVGHGGSAGAQRNGTVKAHPRAGASLAPVSLASPLQPGQTHQPSAGGLALPWDCHVPGPGFRACVAWAMQADGGRSLQLPALLCSAGLAPASAQMKLPSGPCASPFAGDVGGSDGVAPCWSRRRAWAGARQAQVFGRAAVALAAVLAARHSTTAG